MTGVLNINFEVIFYMVVGLFGLVGFLRGWWKEAISTGLLVFLLLLLQRPDLAVIVIDQINKIIDLIRNTGTTISASGATDNLTTIDPATSQFYIVLMIILIAASYIIGNTSINDTRVTAGGRIFGGILGFANGFIALSLLREYVLQRYLPGSGISAASAMPTELTMTVSNVPRYSITDGFTIWLIIIGGAIVFISTFGTRFKYNKGEIRKQVPPGYKAGK